MTTYILVHGAWHGAWCWERFVTELHARGDDAVVMDLPIEDGTKTFADYAAVVVDAAKDAPDDAVIIGHSLGSMVIPLVAAARPVRAMVFLCGVIPNFDGTPWDDGPPMSPAGDLDVDGRDDGSTVWTNAAAARDAFYGSASQADSDWAFERLRPLNGMSLWKDPYPLGDWPRGHRIAIGTTADRAVDLAFVKHACETRLEVVPYELPGDHSPFLSRPRELADMIARALGDR